MSESHHRISSILDNTVDISDEDLLNAPEEPVVERRTVPRRAARWYSVLAIGKESHEATTASISEKVITIDTQVSLAKGQPIIIDIRSIHNGMVRVIRVCGFVRFSHMSKQGITAGISVERIAEKDLVFFRHFANRKI